MRRPTPIVSALLISLGLMLATSPADAGPPFRTDDPEPVELGHFETYLFSLGTRTTNESNGILPGLEVDYGAAPNLQLSTILPLAYTAEAGAPNEFAPGDAEFGAKYRFFVPDSESWLPQAAIYPTVVVPVGDQTLGFSTGHMQVFMPLWLQKDFGSWTAYGGGGYWINSGAGNKNYGFVGTALWHKASDEIRLGMEVFHQTSSASAIEASTGFNVGAIYDASEILHVLASVGTGLQNPITNPNYG